VGTGRGEGVDRGKEGGWGMEGSEGGKKEILVNPLQGYSSLPSPSPPCPCPFGVSCNF